MIKNKCCKNFFVILYDRLTHQNMIVIILHLGVWKHVASIKPEKEIQRVASLISNFSISFIFFATEDILTIVVVMHKIPITPERPTAVPNKLKSFLMIHRIMWVMACIIASPPYHLPVNLWTSCRVAKGIHLPTHVVLNVWIVQYILDKRVWPMNTYEANAVSLDILMRKIWRIPSEQIDSRGKGLVYQWLLHQPRESLAPSL